MALIPKAAIKSFYRNAGFDIDGNLRKSPEGSMSEMPLRHMMGCDGGIMRPQKKELNSGRSC